MIIINKNFKTLEQIEKEKRNPKPKIIFIPHISATSIPKRVIIGPAFMYHFK